jgi:hypothetical protein
VDTIRPDPDGLLTLYVITTFLLTSTDAAIKSIGLKTTTTSFTPVGAVNVICELEMFAVAGFDIYAVLVPVLTEYTTVEEGIPLTLAVTLIPTDTREITEESNEIALELRPMLPIRTMVFAEESFFPAMI